jgi:Family of unknown function (DUF6508)
MPKRTVDIGLLSDWTSWELNVWRRVESTWSCLSREGIELQRPQSEAEDWEYGPEASSYLDALEQFFEQTEERRRRAEVDWSKPVLTECLAKFQNPDGFAEAELWEMFTYLRAATRFSRYPDNNDGGWFADHFKSGGVESAMHHLRVLTGPSLADIDHILALKATFDSLSLDEFRAWKGGDTVQLEDGGEAIHLPWPSYHPVVQEWIEAVWDTPFYIDPYHGIRDGDPIPDPKFLNIGEAGYPSPVEFFQASNLSMVRQYMAVCIRGEKWCDGHIAAEFERGVIQAAFARLSGLSHATMNWQESL